MTRLQSHQKKQFVQKLIFFSICLVILVIVLVFVGLKLLINATLFISNVGNKPTAPATDNSQTFFGTIDVSDIPESTNSAQIFVSGSASNLDTIEFYINGDSVKHKDVSSSDTFSEQIGNLKKGQNEVYVTGKSKNNKAVKESQKYTVVYKADKPKLEITDPQDNATVNKSDLTVSGNTDQDVSIKVNGSPAVVDTQSHFSYTVQLKEGDNTIEIDAEDDAGNTEQKTITVKYQKE